MGILASCWDRYPYREAVPSLQPTLNPIPPRCPPSCGSAPPLYPLLTSVGPHSSMTQRADLLELDCWLSRDGVVVVSHDENLSRQSGLNRDVGSLNFEVGLTPVPLD